MSGQDHVIARRVLVVDDDELVRNTVTALLRDADFEVATAADGEEALTLVARQSFSVVVTDRAMPVIDGIEFTYRLRALAVAPVYVIMLTTSSGDSYDYERGYCAGVDHYLSKKSYQADMVSRVAAGMIAMRRRHAVGAARGNAPVTVDLESGAHTARHLVGRLHAEIARAYRAKLPLSVLSVCIDPPESAPGRQESVNAAASEALLQAVYSSVRDKLDWVARLPAGRSVRLAVVMPESIDADVAAVQQSIRNAFVRSNDGRATNSLKLTMAAAPLDLTKEKMPTALEHIGEAERRRRGQDGLASKEAAAGPTAEIKNVQGEEQPITATAA